MPLLALLLATLPGATSRDTARVNPYAYTTTEIAPNVWGFIEKNLNPVVSSNVIAVAGAKSVLVFDSGHHPALTRSIIADIKRLTHKPVRYVVNSHWHDDHWIGNAEFKAAYPDAVILAHSFTAKLIQTREGHISGESCKAELRPMLPELRDPLANGKRPDGSPLSDTTRNRLTQFLAAVEWSIPECDDVRYRGVDSTFTDSLSIDLGQKRVELRFLGRGNTAGDVIAYLPDSRTVLTGDLLVAPFPFATQSYITEWSGVLGKIDALHARNIVPGHGEVMHDATYLRIVRSTLDSVAVLARRAYTTGMSNEALRAAVDFKPLINRYVDTDPFIRANLAAQLQSALDRMWQELSGEWKDEGIHEQ